MKEQKSVLVTGCAGFIGSNFTDKFSKEFPDIEIVGIDDFSSGRKEVLTSSVAFYEGSMLDEELLEKIFSKHKPEYVFHFAAVPRVSYANKYPVLTTKVNVAGTVALLEASRKHGVKRFIYSASSSVYGGAKKMPTKESENPPMPKSPYAVQKHTGELFCKAFSGLYEMDSVCLRYFNAFGPGQYGDSAYASVVSAWLEFLYLTTGNAPFIEGDGEQSRDFCYIDNVVQANILAMKCENDLKGDSFNIAYGQQTTVNQIKELIEELTGKELALEKRPTRQGDVRHSLADISKAKEILGYDPKIDVRDGMVKTIEWFKSRQSQ